MTIRELNDKLDKFIDNDFRHLEKKVDRLLYLLITIQASIFGAILVTLLS